MFDFIATQVLFAITDIVFQAEFSGLSGQEKHALVKQSIVGLIESMFLKGFSKAFEPFIDSLIDAEVTRLNRGGFFPLPDGANPKIIGVLKLQANAGIDPQVLFETIFASPSKVA